MAADSGNWTLVQLEHRAGESHFHPCNSLKKHFGLKFRDLIHRRPAWNGASPCAVFSLDDTGERRGPREKNVASAQANGQPPP